MLTWAVPQLMEAIDNESTDVNRTLNRIIFGVMHHPAQRDMGDDGIRDGRQLIFKCIEGWWGGIGRQQQDDYRRKLSRDGVERGENHKEGVHDTGHGHGCNGKLKMRKQFGAPETMEDRIAGAAAGAILTGASGAISGIVEQQTGVKIPTYKRPEKKEEDGGEEGGIGGFLGKAGSLLGFGKDETETHSSSRRDEDGSYTETKTAYGHSGGRYGQAEYSKTEYGSGDGGRTEYKEYGQEDRYGGKQSSGYGYEETTESKPSYGGDYEERTESRRWEGSTEESSGGYGSRRNDDDDGEYGSSRRHHKRDEDESGGYGGGREEETSGGWGSSRRDDEERPTEGEGEGFGDILDNAKRVAEGFGGAFGGGGNNEERRW
jgi:hypothetical protein